MCKLLGVGRDVMQASDEAQASQGTRGPAGCLRSAQRVHVASFAGNGIRSVHLTSLTASRD